MAKLTFNASKAEPMQERKLVDEGDYLCQIVKSEIVPNSKKTAERLNMQAKILNGDFKGSMLFIGLNWGHPNPDAQAISDREFKSICDAVGKGDEQIEDTDVLHGIPFVATVKHSAPSGEYKENGETKYKYGPKAEIRAYLVAEGSDLLEGFDPSEEPEDAKPAPKTPPWGDKKED